MAPRKAPLLPRYLVHVENDKWTAYRQFLITRPMIVSMQQFGEEEQRYRPCRLVLAHPRRLKTIDPWSS